MPEIIRALGDTIFMLYMIVLSGVGILVLLVALLLALRELKDDSHS